MRRIFVNKLINFFKKKKSCYRRKLHITFLRIKLLKPLSKNSLWYQLISNRLFRTNCIFLFFFFFLKPFQNYNYILKHKKYKNKY
jgi:hypothetical protein